MKIKELLETHDKEKERCRLEIISIQREVTSLKESIERNKNKIVKREKLLKEYLDMDVDKWIKKFPNKNKRK